MKKIWPFMVIVIFFLSGLGLVNAHEEENNLESYRNILFSQPIINDENEYIEVSLKEANSFLMKQGKPMLPISIQEFSFAFGTKIKSVTCTPKNIQIQTLTKDIMPTPDIGVTGQKLTNNVIKSIDYGTKPYPNKWYQYDMGCGLEGSKRTVFVKVEVYPIQYDPAEKTIEWAKEFDIKVEYESSSKPLATNEAYSFVILTPSEYSSYLSSLVTHKNDRGIPTKLVTLPEIYSGTYFPVKGRDDQEKIKYFIKDAIENWGITNVMLVGGSQKFPTRQTHVFIGHPINDNEAFLSDLYYADIYDYLSDFCSWDSNENNRFGEFNWSGNYDSVDLYPDVNLGRLACTSTSQVTTCVNKIKTYENNQAYTQGWFTNLTVIGGDTFVPGDDDSGIDEGELVNQEIVNIMSGFLPDKVWATNGRLGKILPPYGIGEIDDAINAGCGFVDWSGHGNTNLWGSHPHESGQNVWIPTPYPPGVYYSSEVTSLSNGDKLPIVIVGGCSCGKFNTDNNCFAWRWLSNSNGGGITSIGSTGLLYSYSGIYVTYGLAGLIGINMFKAFKNLGAFTFGEMWNKAITEYIKTHTMYDADYKTIEQCIAFGDPTLAIAEQSKPPNKPSRPTGTLSGLINVQYTYTSSATDPDGDPIQFQFDWGDGTASNWIGPMPSGSQVSANKTWSKTGTFKVRVVAKDDHGKVSEWSDSIAVKIPRNKVLNRPFFRFLDNHPLLFSILKQLLQLLEIY